MAEHDKSILEKDFNLTKHFPYPTYEDWKFEAEKLLKGAPFDKVLKTETVEGITLKAIYNEEDIKDIHFTESKPGVFPFVRGNSGSEKVVNGWYVQQEIEAENLSQWNEILVQDLQKGQNSFMLHLGRETTIEDLRIAFKGIDLTKVYFDLIAHCGMAHVYDKFEQYLTENKIDMNDVKGSITADVIKCIGEACAPSEVVERLLNETAEVSKKSKGIKTILVDLSGFNNLGSSAVEDIGLMASIVVFYTEEMLKRGLHVNEIFSKMTFSFGVSNNLFMEIAKLRAARIIVSKLVEVYGADKEHAKMHIHARTSDYTKTYFDPWVNILRTTTEAFSAIVGGCDSLHVTPFDSVIGQPDEFSRRIARNQQMVLMEESHLNAVNDPAGGSYYVEALTNEIVNKGWEYFLQLEDEGSIIDALKNGKVFERVNKSHETRVKNAETRKDAIVGTSTFPNLNEKRPVKQVSDIRNQVSSKKPHQKKRLAESFEELRKKVEDIHPRPEVYVINIGKTVSNKPRVDFCVGYFEPAGFIAKTDDGYECMEMALQKALECDANVVVLSSTDANYPDIVPSFAKSFKELAPKKVLCLAGYPKDHIEAFSQAGVDYYIYMRANLVTNIKDILKKLGV